MVGYNIVSVACMSMMIAGLLLILINLIVKPRAERIEYIRSFKKGKGVLIYIVALPLFWIGLVYGGQSILNGFFLAVPKILELIVLKYSIDPIITLVEANSFYAFTVYFCFILVGLNAIMFALSLVGQTLWNHCTSIRFAHTKKERLVLFGNNHNNCSIYKSDKFREKTVVDKISANDALSLYMKNICYKQATSNNQIILKLVKDVALKNKKTVAIINTDDDAKNIDVAKSIIQSINTLDEAKRSLCFGRLKVFVFGDPKYETIYESLIKDSCGCISYINKYQKIAIDFIDKYPFTRFMNENHIDYKTATIKNGVEINALLIGFGKTNQQIFTASVANNQFITKNGSDIGLKTVNYYCFDKANAENNKNLNHNYYRFKNECKEDAQFEYLKYPAYPAKEYFKQLDINDASFYNEIRNVTTASEKSVNFVIVAFGSDLENIDMAQKIATKAKEWNAKNITVFVKVRENYIDSSMINLDNCFIIANEKDTVYNINCILNDKVFYMSQLRNEAYEIEKQIKKENGKELSKETIDSIISDAKHKWYVEKSQLERDSNLYACLSLRSKLNLIGLDYSPQDSSSKSGLTNDEFYAIYAKDDYPDDGLYHVKANGKTILNYTLDFKNSLRKNLAIHEHYRWNSFMISKGIIPATRKQIKEERDKELVYTNGRNYALRRHGNLTTFDGLMEFRSIISERDYNNDKTKDMSFYLLQNDVFKYDYQLMDDAYWLINKIGCKIVSKN